MSVHRILSNLPEKFAICHGYQFTAYGMYAHVLLNLLNELGKMIRCETVPSILPVFCNKFNKFNNTGAQMQDSIYHMTLKSHFISILH